MRLFGDLRLHEFLSQRLPDLKREIHQQDEQYILNVNEAQFIEYLCSKYCVEPLQIQFDGVTLSEQKKMVPYRGHPALAPRNRKSEHTVITLHIPFSGSRALLSCAPSSGLVWSEEVGIRGDELLYEVICYQPDKSAVERDYIEFKGLAQKQLGNVNAEVGEYNDSVQKYALNAFRQRKDELLEKNSFVASLGIPLKSSTNVPDTFSVPVAQPKKIRVTAPKVGTKPFSPEPTMDMQAYIDILQTIHDVGKQFERIPSTYSGKDEESLRDHILMVLEPQFEGSATGETFNKSGKTDILLRDEGKNLFVGECKFWAGKKGFHKTIDQILNYLTWRDSKVAVIIFVRNKEITPVLEKVRAEAPLHRCYDSFVKCVDESWSEYNFHLPDDTNRAVNLAVQVFHLPPASINITPLKN